MVEGAYPRPGRRPIWGGNANNSAVSFFATQPSAPSPADHVSTTLHRANRRGRATAHPTQGVIIATQNIFPLLRLGQLTGDTNAINNSGCSGSAPGMCRSIVMFTTRPGRFAVIAAFLLFTGVLLVFASGARADTIYDLTPEVFTSNSGYQFVLLGGTIDYSGTGSLYPYSPSGLITGSFEVGVPGTSAPFVVTTPNRYVLVGVWDGTELCAASLRPVSCCSSWPRVRVKWRRYKR